MKEIVINGGKPLNGTVKVSGSKNGALPILFATLITRGVSRLCGVPDIGDVDVALRILRSFGAGVLRTGDILYIDTEHLTYADPDPQLVSQIRASTYVIGASLGRFGKCSIGRPGGCNFSDRPIDMHLFAARSLGAVQNGEYLEAKKLQGSDIAFDKPSVGATVNAIIMACAAEGVTNIYGFAKEPHVMALIDFLRTAGADISLTETCITVKHGVSHGGEAEIIGDMIEAGTYLAAGVITNGSVTVTHAPVSDMTTFIDFLRKIGAKITVLPNSITVSRGSASAFARVIAEPYPGFPTDLQPIAAPVMAALSGGEIYDTVWQGRYGYLRALSAFGLEHRTMGFGAHILTSSLHFASTVAPDLRGAAACVLAALSAVGESRIRSAELMLRGYEHPDIKLRSLGADIRIIEC